MEGRPAGGVETFANPCDKWFCTKAKLGPDSETKVFATGFMSQGRSHFPMAWDLDNTDVPGEDRTEYYHAACAQC